MTDQTIQKSSLQNQIGLGNTELIKPGHSRLTSKDKEATKEEKSWLHLNLNSKAPFDSSELAGLPPAMAAWVKKIRLRALRDEAAGLGGVLFHELWESLENPLPGDPFISEMVAWMEVHGLTDRSEESRGITPLLVLAGAIKEWYGAVVLIDLIAAFSNWDAVDSGGQGVLDIAKKGGNPEVIAYVIAYQEQRALRQSIPKTENQCSPSRKTRTL